jgi:NADH-quinone oxidoreductase subunit L
MLLNEVAPANQGFFGLVPLVVFIPLLGMLINIAFGRRLSERAVGSIASGASGLAFVVSVLLAISLTQHHEGVVVPFLDWITIGELSIPWAFQVDTLSVTMMLVVSGVGTLIHIYAIGYMHEDVRHHNDPASFPRFFIYFNLFIAAMMILVSANNYLMLFVGWEGVGLCSFLLIGFWFTKGKDGIGNAMAAKKAFVVNRIGDFGFLIAGFLMFWHFGSFTFNEVLPQAHEVAQSHPGVILAITLFMLLGVAGKSAQIPLFVWLPDAMAGPTPVSALIHAATMVTAGVYLIARSHPLYVEVPQAQNIVAWVGASTALFAATIAVAQFDIKKVLAYSTVSQLGFMVAAVGMGAFVAGMFHLVMHAFFKALLFLGSGSVIQGMEHGLHHVEHDPRLKKTLRAGHLAHGHTFDVQDMRNMGGMRDRMKTTYWVYLIGALALAGIIPFAGFWSKDEILIEALLLNPGVYYVLLVAALFTAFYTARQIFMVFWGEARTSPAAHATERPLVMTVPLIILAVLSLLGGFINTPWWHGLGYWLEETIHVPHPEVVEGMVSPFGGFNPIVAGIATATALGGIALAYYLYMVLTQKQRDLPAIKRPDDPLRPMIKPAFIGMENKWWIDELYWAVIVNPYIRISRFLAEVVDWRFWHDWFHDKVIVGGYTGISWLLAKPIDQGLIDGASYGLSNLTRGFADLLRRTQTGFVRNYALTVFLGVVVIVGYLILR